MSGRCQKHDVELRPGLTQDWCVPCLDELAHSIPSSRFLLGHTLEETDQKLRGEIDLKNHLQQRSQAQKEVTK